MKFLLIGISVLFFILLSIAIFEIYKLKNIKYNKPQILYNKKILTVYYSNNGNTKSVAQKIHSIVGGDLKEINLIENYPDNIFKMSKLTRKQIKTGFLPQIRDVDISGYDIIFVGSPIWNLSISLPIKSFFTNQDFKGKTIIPFFTYSGGANKNNILNEIQKLTNSADTKQSLFMFENGIFLIKEQIIKWLNNI